MYILLEVDLHLNTIILANFTKYVSRVKHFGRQLYVDTDGFIVNSKYTYTNYYLILLNN